MLFTRAAAHHNVWEVAVGLKDVRRLLHRSCALRAMPRAPALEPLAKAMEWDWRLLSCAVLVSHAWHAAFNPHLESLRTRLEEQLPAVRATLEEDEASPEHSIRTGIVDAIDLSMVDELVAFHTPPIGLNEVFCLIFHLVPDIRFSEPPSLASECTRWVRRRTTVFATWSDVRRALTASPIKHEFLMALSVVRMVDVPVHRLLQVQRVVGDESKGACPHLQSASAPTSLIGALCVRRLRALLGEWEAKWAAVQAAAPWTALLLTIEAELRELEARAKAKRVAAERARALASGRTLFRAQAAVVAPHARRGEEAVRQLAGALGAKARVLSD